ncbi:MAG: lycopene cyclase domain-containing protein [Candidatus Omnitrophota bacterium]
MSKYFFALLASGIIPLLASFWPGLHFWRNRLNLFKVIALVVFIFGGWDVIATYRGHWSFDPHSVWPARIINLPIEEILFFVVIPFCCIFTWEIVNYIRGRIR